MSNSFRDAFRRPIDDFDARRTAVLDLREAIVDEPLEERIEALAKASVATPMRLSPAGLATRAGGNRKPVELQDAEAAE